MPSGFSALMQSAKRALVHRHEDDVVDCALGGEVLLRVVDGVLGAKRPHQLEIRAAAYGGDLRAVVLGELDGEGADAARGSVDQDLLAALDVRLLEKVERRAGSDRARRRLLRRSCWPASGRSRRSRGGTRTRRSRRIRMMVAAKTWSPCLNRVTSLPVSSISPESSAPRIRRLGFSTPRARRAGIQNERGTVKLLQRKSGADTVVARTRISTSSSRGTGLSTSARCRTSGGPYRCRRPLSSAHGPSAGTHRWLLERGRVGRRGRHSTVRRGLLLDGRRARAQLGDVRGDALLCVERRLRPLLVAGDELLQISPRGRR